MTQEKYMKGNSSQIQPVQVRAVCEFIQAAFKGDAFDFNQLYTTFVPLIGGQSRARLYRCEIKNQPFVVRVLPESAPYAERERQISLMCFAGERGVGPSIHFVTREKDALIMSYINGSTVSSDTFTSDGTLRDFARLLRQLHGYSVKVPIAQPPFQRFKDFLSGKNLENSPLADKIASARDIMNEIDLVLNRNPTRMAPAHLDLHSQNIMHDRDRFVLVDWVNGGLSDPFLDLATFIVFLKLDPGRASLLINEYLGRPPMEKEWARLQLLLPVRPFVVAAAMLSLQPLQSSLRGFSLQECPTFEDFVREHAAGTLDWPPSLSGEVLLQCGLGQVRKIV